MNNFISLIIPVYNVAPYVRDCFRSVLAQIPANCEVICVDDGSTDNSMAEIRALTSEFPEKYQQIRFLAQSNNGLSVARNAGLDAATGTYIAFLDSDDLMMPNYFARITEALSIHPDASMVCFNAYYFQNESGYDQIARCAKLSINPGKNTIYPQFETHFNRLIHCFAFSRWFTWARVYHRSLFDGKRFTPGYRFQDVMLTPELYLNALVIANIDDPLIAYRDQPNNTTSQPDPTVLENLDGIIHRYQSPLPGVDARLAPLQSLVIIECLAGIFNCSKRMYGRHRATLELRRRLRALNTRQTIQAFAICGTHIRHTNAWLVASPTTYLIYAKLKREAKNIVLHSDRYC